MRVETKLPTGAVDVLNGMITDELYTTNSMTAISGAETRVPIVAEMDGGAMKTFYAVIRKNSLDQWLDFIRVDGRDLSLNRNPETNELEAMATVYNTTRDAILEIQTAESGSVIDLERAEYTVYVPDGSGNMVELIKDGKPVRRTDTVGKVTHLLYLPVESLNDGLNYFYVTVTPSNSNYPPRLYTVIINYMNLDIRLDDLRVYDVKPEVLNGGDPTDMNAGKYISFTNREYFSPLVDKYTFDYEPGADGKGHLRVYADATKSYNDIKRVLNTYYSEQYYPGLLGQKYYTIIYEALQGAFPEYASESEVF